MTVEEIERILQKIAANQSRHDEMHARHSEHMAEMERAQARHAANMAKLEEMQARHSADIAEIYKGIESLLNSQNRYDECLATISDIMHDLADKHLKNEERFAETDKRFAELAAAQVRYEARQEHLEGFYQLFEKFVMDFRNEAYEHFTETDKRLAEFISETNRRFAEADERMNRTDRQINALILSQTHTDELVRSMLERNGSAAMPKAKVKKARKAGKKGSAK